MARPDRTYRAARRNRAKLARRQNGLSTTVGGAMEPAPTGCNGAASSLPRRTHHRVSRKTYAKGNVPGGARRAALRVLSEGAVCTP